MGAAIEGKQWGRGGGRPRVRVAPRGPGRGPGVSQWQVSMGAKPYALAKANGKAATLVHSLDDASAKMMSGIFADGCAEPSRARIGSEIIGDPWVTRSTAGPCSMG